MKITSLESLDAHVAEVVRMKLELAGRKVEMEEQIAALQKRYAGPIGKLNDDIAARTDDIRDYCDANRSALFPDKKSRETLTALVGFEWTPYRVETAAKKITWKLVVQRLLRLDWGGAYVRQPEPQPDKNAMLADRERFTGPQLLAAGIAFDRDEQFFLRPKSEIATDTVKREVTA